MKFLFYSVFLLLLGPCSGQKKAGSTFAQKIPYSSVIISFKAGACFGKCPNYTLTINGETKMMTYEGTGNTERMGKYSKSITDEELNALVKQFDDAKFFTLDDEYLGNIVDFAINNISYTKEGQTKMIRVRSNLPKELKDIQNQLIYLANTEGWKKE